MSYTIRQVATQFHMQPSTLRYYEDQGLLCDVERDDAGRTETGQRIYEDCHIDRLCAICCFKNAGMTIDDLKKFFVYESNEPEHIDEILDLLESRRESLDEQRRALNEAAMHVQRKLHYYGDIKRAIDAGEDCVYPSKALLGSARSSSQTTSDITKNAMASLPQLMPNPCQPSASRLMKSYGYGLPPAAGPDPGQIAARASTKTKYAGKYASHENM